MRALLDRLTSLPEIGEIFRRLETGKTPVLLTGLSPIHKAHVIAAIRRKTGRCVAVIGADDRALSRIALDAEVFAGEESAVLVPKEQIFYQADSASRESEQRRIAFFYEWERTPLAFLSAEAAAARTLPPEILKKAVIRLRVGDILEPAELSRRLVDAGYRRVEAIDARSGGEFAVRGSIFDIYPVNAELPYRIDFFDDEVDSIARFSTETQRRVDQTGEAVILPAAEALPRYAEGGIEGCAERIRLLEERLKRRKKLSDKLGKRWKATEKRFWKTGPLPRSTGSIPRFTENLLRLWIICLLTRSWSWTIPEGSPKA